MKWFSKRTTIYARYRWTCCFCDKRFKLAEILHKHLIENHQAFKPFVYNFCGEKFEVDHELQDHLKLSQDGQGCWTSLEEILYEEVVENLDGDNTTGSVEENPSTSITGFHFEGIVSPSTSTFSATNPADSNFQP